MNQRDRHKTFRLGLGQTADEVPPSHAGVDQNRHRGGLEQAENQCDEVDARPNQQGQPRARPRAHVAQPSGDPIAILVELAEGDVPVASLAAGVVVQRLDHGHRVRPGLGHRGEPAGDVVRTVHHRPYHGGRTATVQCPAIASRLAGQ